MPGPPAARRSWPVPPSRPVLSPRGRVGGRAFLPPKVRAGRRRCPRSPSPLAGGHRAWHGGPRQHPPGTPPRRPPRMGPAPAGTTTPLPTPRWRATPGASPMTRTAPACRRTPPRDLGRGFGRAVAAPFAVGTGVACLAGVDEVMSARQQGCPRARAGERMPGPPAARRSWPAGLPRANGDTPTRRTPPTPDRAAVRTPSVEAEPRVGSGRSGPQPSESP